MKKDENTCIVPYSKMGKQSSISPDHVKYHQVENSHASCDTMFNLIRKSKWYCYCNIFQIQTATRYSKTTYMLLVNQLLFGFT